MRYATCLAITACLSAHAQVNYPFPDSAALWVQSWSLMVTQPPMPQFEVMGISNIHIPGVDTVIGGASYSKVEQFGMDYVGAVRQDAGKVYFQPADSLEAFLLYDFTLELGDTVHDVYVDGGLAFNGWSDYPYLVDYVVTEVGEVQGRIFVRLVQPPLPGGAEQLWIEGFGSPWGLFSVQDPINVSGADAGLGCMSHRDTMWSFNEWGITAILDWTCTPQYLGIEAPPAPSLSMGPIPTSGLLTIGPGAGTDATAFVRDAFGRSVDVPTQVGGDLLQLDFAGQPDGVYLIVLRRRGAQSVHRVVRGE